jgi:peptidoglycan/LPS O-acetylase OafA/YrhL
MSDDGTAARSAGGSWRRPELDGLRGLAVLLVIYHHYVNGALQAPAGTFLSYALVPGRLAWTGVDLFFVLSGYLIGGILIRNRQSPSYFRTFYIRRACRILPLYLVVAFLFYFAPVPSWGGPRAPFWQYLTLTQNFWMASAGTFGMLALAPTWSLAIEEQFYFTVPSLIRFVRREWLGRVVLICIALAPLLRWVLFLTLGRQSYFASHVLLFTRMDTLLIGVYAAWLQERGVVIPRRLLYAAWWVLAAGMLYISWKDGGRSASPLIRFFCYDWFALFYLSMLLIATQGGFRLLRIRALTYTGLISYGLYLFHHPLHAWMVEHLHRTEHLRYTLVMLISVTALFLVASLSWRFLEKPFVDLGHRSSRYD